MALQKKFFWVYGRQTTTKTVITSLDQKTELIADTGVMGPSPFQGQTNPATFTTQVTNWALIGEMSSGGQKGIGADAFVNADKGDTLALAGGDIPVISEKIMSELKSFDVDAAAWSTAAISGAAGAMPLRKRLCTLETTVNVDLAFIDPTIASKDTGTAVCYFVWDVPFHVGFAGPAADVPSLPCSVDKDVSNASDYLDIVTVDLAT